MEIQKREEKNDKTTQELKIHDKQNVADAGNLKYNCWKYSLFKTYVGTNVNIMLLIYCSPKGPMRRNLLCLFQFISETESSTVFFLIGLNTNKESTCKFYRIASAPT